MNVGEICSHRIISVPVGTSLSDAVALMYGERVGTVIVTRTLAGQSLVAGILTDRDIVRAQLHRIADFSQLSIADAMTSNPLVVRADEDSSVVLEKLRMQRVRRAPVVDELGAPIGLISIDDLLQHLARQITGLAAIVASQAAPRL
jgi:CBS domain-containing protein